MSVQARDSRVPENNPSLTHYLPAPLVAERYSVSLMTLWRWQRKSDFPKPLYIGKNRYWDLSELMAWEASRPRGRPLH
ncbi:conserved hypothetical protein [Mesorhizobium plurifarium]|uniref:Uncharacterized protein n=1 Tax=Mesorhizobium plurifarium TaxID=69974 RepID=A0A0K2W5V1_MESPL|nr:conserved hypothetical protein [Mesorhizobium plurifarium]